MKSLDRKKMLINNGNKMFGTVRLRGGRLARARRWRHRHREYIAELGRTYSFINEGSDVDKPMC
jgi:hypothetical protein